MNASSETTAQRSLFFFFFSVFISSLRGSTIPGFVQEQRSQPHFQGDSVQIIGIAFQLILHDVEKKKKTNRNSQIALALTVFFVLWIRESRKQQRLADEGGRADLYVKGELHSQVIVQIEPQAMPLNLPKPSELEVYEVPVEVNGIRPWRLSVGITRLWG